MQNIILISTPANMIYTIINLVITFNLLHRDVCMQLAARLRERGGRRWRRWAGCPCKWGSEWLARSLLIGAALQPQLQPAASSPEKEVTRYWD